MSAAAAKKTAAAKPADEKPAEKSKGGGLVVIAPLISVRVGDQVLQYRVGDVLPGGIDEDSLQHLTDLGFIAEQ